MTLQSFAYPICVMWSKPTEARKPSNMTSFKNKITRRKRKLSTGGGISNVQFLSSKLLENKDTILADEGIVVPLSPVEMLNRKSDPAKFYAYNDQTKCAPSENQVDSKKNSALERPVWKDTDNSQLFLFVKQKSASLGKHFRATNTIKESNDSSSISVGDSNQLINFTDDNTEITFANCSNSRDVNCTDNCGDDVISPAKCDGVEIRVRHANSVEAIHSSLRYSDSCVSTSKNTREKTIDRSNATKICRFDRHTVCESSGDVKYKAENSSLYRSRIQKPAELKMQYKVADGAEKQMKTSDTSENKRSAKNKKKAVKNKQLDVDCNDGDLVKAPVNTTTQKTDSEDKKNKKAKDAVNNDSYLKRVKSKIYKHSRSDSSVSQNSSEGVSDNETKTKPKKMKEKKVSTKSSKIPKICDNIPEETICENPKLKKSASTIFLRQYSNLERVRPKTFGVRSGGFFGVTDLVDSTANILNVPVEPPKLTKSKSSSAINLNLLRARRNKIQEQSKNCKNADTEFSFITYNVPQKAVISSRKFDKCNIGDTLVEQKERPSSWIPTTQGTLIF